MLATAPPVANSRWTGASRWKVFPRRAASSDQITWPARSHTLMCTIDLSRSRLRMTRENSLRLASSPVRTPRSTSGPPTTCAKVMPRDLACRSATSWLTSRETKTVATITRTRTTRLTAMNRRSARLATELGRPLSGSGGGVDIDESVPHGDRDGLELGVCPQLREQALHVAPAGVDRDVHLRAGGPGAGPAADHPQTPP